MQYCVFVASALCLSLFAQTKTFAGADSAGNRICDGKQPNGVEAQSARFNNL